MMNSSTMGINALFFKIMANKDRLKIMSSVSNKPKTVTQICNDTGFEQSWVSHSLRILREGGIVDSKREGKNIYYKLDNGIKPVIIAANKITIKYKSKGGE